MVAGKVKLSMGFQKSPAHHSKSKLDTPPPPPKPPSPSPASAKITSQKSTAFSRSYAQVQPKPPNVSELLRLVEHLRDGESRLKTELVDHKLLRETVTIVPVLESEIDFARTRIAALEAENARLRAGKDRAEEEARESECRAKKMEAEIPQPLHQHLRRVGLHGEGDQTATHGRRSESARSARKTLRTASTRRQVMGFPEEATADSREALRLPGRRRAG